MWNQRHALTSLILGAALLACGGEDATQSRGAPASQVEADAERSELVRRAEVQITALEREVEQARVRMHEMGEEGAEQLSEAVERAEVAREDVDEWLEELEEGASDKAREARSKLSEGLQELARLQRELAQALRPDEEPSSG